MTSSTIVTSDAQLELSLSGFLDAAVRRWRLIALIGLGAGALTAIVTLATPRRYTVRAAVTPVGAKAPGGGLSGLAAVAGLSLGAGSTLAPEYYTEIAGSDDLLRRVVEAPAVVGDTASGSRTLAARVLGRDDAGDDTAPLTQRAIVEVREMLGTRISQKSGIVTLSISSPDPELSMRLVLEVVRQLDEVNRVARTARNEAELRFLESRLGETRVALDRTEREMERFLAANRAFNSPGIELERQRVTRTMELARATYVSVANAYDEARIEAFRDTPTLSVIGVPRVPLGPDPRGLVTKSVFATVGFMLLAVLLLFAHEWVVALWPDRAPFAAFASGAVKRA